MYWTFITGYSSQWQIIDHNFLLVSRVLNRKYPFLTPKQLFVYLNAKPGKRGHIILLRAHCCQHKCFPYLPTRSTFVVDSNFVSGTQKNVSDFVQKHFVSATKINVSLHSKRNIMNDKCVRNNVSSFARAFKIDAWGHHTTRPFSICCVTTQISKSFV